MLRNFSQASRFLWLGILLVVATLLPIALAMGAGEPSSLANRKVIFVSGCSAGPGTWTNAKVEPWWEHWQKLENYLIQEDIGLTKDDFSYI